jgi:hypothetical protein
MRSARSGRELTSSTAGAFIALYVCATLLAPPGRAIMSSALSSTYPYTVPPPRAGGGVNHTPTALISVTDITLSLVGAPHVRLTLAPDACLVLTAVDVPVRMSPWGGSSARRLR